MRRVEGSDLRVETRPHLVGQAQSGPAALAVIPLHRTPDLKAVVPGQAANEPHLDPRCEALISDWLKAHYAQILDQPLPERFSEILAAIDAAAGERR